ncbi:hypothetical protein ACP26L_23510 [Paenibacillus sp. S-38]|uniref:hypothetical protein n=1 Tax=Paenibacillus sp. S-38 TaxID=3416710 RepID=UPI003CE6718E
MWEAVIHFVMNLSFALSPSALKANINRLRGQLWFQQFYAEKGNAKEMRSNLLIVQFLEDRKNIDELLASPSKQTEFMRWVESQKAIKHARARGSRSAK